MCFNSKGFLSLFYEFLSGSRAISRGSRLLPYLGVVCGGPVVVRGFGSSVRPPKTSLSFRGVLVRTCSFYYLLGLLCFSTLERSSLFAFLGAYGCGRAFVKFYVLLSVFCVGACRFIALFCSVSIVCGDFRSFSVRVCDVRTGIGRVFNSIVADRAGYVF